MVQIDRPLEGLMLMDMLGEEEFNPPNGLNAVYTYLASRGIIEPYDSTEPTLGAKVAKSTESTLNSLFQYEKKVRFNLMMGDNDKLRVDFETANHYNILEQKKVLEQVHVISCNWDKSAYRPAKKFLETINLMEENQGFILNEIREGNALKDSRLAMAFSFPSIVYTERFEDYVLSTLGKDSFAYWAPKVTPVENERQTWMP